MQRLQFPILSSMTWQHFSVLLSNAPIVLNLFIEIILCMENYGQVHSTGAKRMKDKSRLGALVKELEVLSRILLVKDGVKTLVQRMDWPSFVIPLRILV